MDKALQTYRRVLQLRPSHGDANLALANLLAANDPEEALRLYNRALFAQPRNKEILRAIAAIHQRQGFTAASWKLTPRMPPLTAPWALCSPSNVVIPKPFLSSKKRRKAMSAKAIAKLPPKFPAFWAKSVLNLPLPSR